MSLTVGQASQVLLNGNKLSWSASGGAPDGAIRLPEPAQRRLFNFLLASDPQSVSEGSESLFAGLIKAWQEEESDSVSELSAESGAAVGGSWRLHAIETTNFGGLNSYNGPPFRLELDGENWCLEGHNGSGKTLLASAIIWALTGCRLREHDGPQTEDGIRAPVHDDGGRKIGNWPALATYPPNSRNLKDTVKVRVALEFHNASGEQALATRELVSPPKGAPDFDAAVDPRLLEAPELIEAGLLMPARLGQISFASKSSSLYEAIKMLTGLDQLFSVAEGASAFTNKGRRFLKYSKDQNIGAFVDAFKNSLANAIDTGKRAGLAIPDALQLGDDDSVQVLESLSHKATTEAGELLTLLKLEITENIALDSFDGREQLSNAVSAARLFIKSGINDQSLFQAWKVLTVVSSDRSLENLSGQLPAFEARLGGALTWHKKQLADEKFRLKALAARFFFGTR